MTSAPLALTLGDPAGIGPEIIAKAWRALKDEGPAFVVLGDRDLLAAQGAPTVEAGSLADAARSFAEALPVLEEGEARATRHRLVDGAVRERVPIFDTSYTMIALGTG